RFRAVVAVTPDQAKQPQLGVVAVQANTTVDDDTRSVLMTGLDVAVRFPGMPDDQAAPLKALVKQCLPGMSFLDVPLDQVLSHMHAPPDLPKVPLNLD